MSSFSAKAWVLSPPQKSQALHLASDYKISPLLAQLLINRRVPIEEVSQFLHPSFSQLPDPKQMLGMEEALDRLVKAIQQQEKITIYGDYDVDGCTSTALLMDFLTQVGAKVDYYIPHRVKEGYSLNPQALHQLKEQGSKVIITVDNGISAIQSAQIAQELKLDLIITDHHELPANLPPALAILNPKLHGPQGWGRELAGVGVAFYLAMGLRRALREQGYFKDQEPDLKQALDLVALGTIADMAPLRGLNRLLVKEGLKVLTSTKRPGLQALKQVCAYTGEIKASQVAFHLGPRLNAVGRLEEASLGVELLLSQDLDQAQSLARRLDQANRDRRILESQITEEALAKVEAEDFLQNYQSLVLLGQNWHPGVVGIVASRLVEKHYLPSIVLTQDGEYLKGSARSIKGFSMVEALEACSSYLSKFGGHTYAAGLSLLPEKLEDFRQAFDQQVRLKLKPEDFKPSLSLDASLGLEDIHPSLMEELKLLEPCGLGNPEAVFCLEKAQVKGARIVGEKHLKLQLVSGAHQLEAIAFGKGEDYLLPDGAWVRTAFMPQWNEWQGVERLQLRILEIKDPQA
ncbi:MAG: single-stranded-DNA-specific exonuclease RecJ [Deltaproteobacteria bacterium]|nr:single-stranded-DNA-specific exonuclease RecJ [Deltaproteobacteria bacterium]